MYKELAINTRQLALSQNAQREAFLGDTSLTFGDVHSKAIAVGISLREAGLQAGDRVAIATSQGSSFYICFTACIVYGFPIVIIDPGAGRREFELMLHKAKPSAAFLDEEVLQRLTDDVANALPRNVWRVSQFRSPAVQARPAVTVAGRNVRDFPSLDELDHSAAAPGVFSGRQASPAYMIFTSGTTANPKAVVVSRRALLRHVATLAKVFGYGRDARLLHFLPTHHTDGLIHGVAASLLTGMTVVHPGTFDVTVNLEQVLRTNEISHFLSVPTMLAMIRRAHNDCEKLFQYDGFRNLISTAGYLDKKFWQEFQEFFGIRVSNFYGMTETVSGSLYCGPDEDTFRIGTVGKPVDAQVQIVDVNGAPLPDGQTGELRIRGEHLMNGYLDDPEATRSAITDGWLSTGDLLFKDANGFFHFVGRKKNIIKRGGITVYPEDIRRVIADMPGVVEVEVIGFPDASFEEIIVVCAVVQTGVGVDDIRALCRQELARERRPDRVELFEQLPRGRSGKVQLNALIAKITKNATQAMRSDGSLRRQIIALAAGIFAMDATDLDETSSPDTVDNWDSYAGMELVLALEKEFDLRLRPADFMKIDSLGAAIEVVSSAIKDADLAGRVGGCDA